MITVRKIKVLFPLYSSVYRPLWSKIEKVAIKTYAENFLLDLNTRKMSK